MRRLRLLQLLLCLALWARLCDGAAMKICKCKDVEKLKGLYTDRPCNECASGYYRTCTGGSYYAHHPTMCIYTSRQNYTHEEAGKMCVDRDVSGFPAFVKDREESYHISHYVWNMLKNGVEGDETYFWVGGKYKRSERTNETFWLFEYRGYYDEVPRELLPDDAALEQAIRENRTCLAGHTELHTMLYPRHCEEELPAVCYNYRQTAKHFCEQVDGKSWTLFQGKCFYAYSSPTKTEDYADYKTFFDAQKECGEMNATVATVTDEATFKRTLDLATGREKILDIDDATWIGLQLSAMGYGGIYYYPNGTTREFKKFTDYPPKADRGKVRPLPADQVEGWWQDGTRYDKEALERFWAIDTVKGTNSQPNEVRIGEGSDAHDGCNATKIRDSDRHLCQRDPFQHCTQVFPGGTNEIVSTSCKTTCEFFANKWNDRWCYFRQRGYICQRDATSEGDRDRLNDEL